MGTYTCEANNGIPPASKQEFVVQVHCNQLIAIKNQLSH